MDQRMFKFRWKQKYQLYLKTWMRKSESTRQYVFLQQSAASDPLKTLKEHGGCGSLMYNCHLMSLKSSPGDLNDNMRARSSLTAPWSVAIARSALISADSQELRGAGCAGAGQAGIGTFLHGSESNLCAERQGYVDGSSNKATRTSQRWLCCKLGVSAAFARRKDRKIKSDSENE